MIKQRKKCLNNEGATLVLIIVCMLFVGIIAAAVLRLTVGNRKTIQTVEESSQNFYSTETIVDDVKIFLQKIANTAATEAYADMLQTIAINATADADVAFDTAFTASLKNKLEGGLALDTQIDAITCSAFAASGESNTSGSIARVAIENGTYDAATNTLKAVTISFTDDSGYTSTIVTDFAFSANRPAAIVAEEQKSIKLPIDKFLIIANGDIKAKNVNVSGSLKGSIYSGNDIDLSVATSNNIDISAKYLIAKNSLKVNGNMYFNRIDKNYLDLEKYAAAYTPVADQDNGNVWVNNIELGAAASMISTDARVFVADDLSLEGDGALFAMNTTHAAGTGYGEDKAYPSYVGYNSDDSRLGSAIVLNGENTKLDLTNARNVQIAGTAYTEVSQIFGTYNKSLDYFMKQGESVTYRSLQTMYMVPGDCLTGVGHNPMTQSEHDAWVSAGAKIEKVPETLGFTPTLSTSRYKEARVVYAEDNTEARYYIYWDFASIQNAADYFNQLSSASKQRAVIEQRIKMINGGYIRLPDASVIHTNGGLVTYESGTLGYKARNWDSNDGTECSEYSSAYTGLLSGLSTSAAGGTTTEMFTKIVPVAVEDTIGYKVATKKAVEAGAGSYKEYDLKNPSTWTNGEAVYTGKLVSVDGGGVEVTADPGTYKLIVGNRFTFSPDSSTKYVVIGVNVTDGDGNVTKACVDIADDTIFNGIIISEGDVRIGTGVTMKSFGNMKVHSATVEGEDESDEYMTELACLLNVYTDDSKTDDGNTILRSMFNVAGNGRILSGSNSGSAADLTSVDTSNWSKY